MPQSYQKDALVKDAFVFCHVILSVTCFGTRDLAGVRPSSDLGIAEVFPG